MLSFLLLATGFLGVWFRVLTFSWAGIQIVIQQHRGDHGFETTTHIISVDYLPLLILAAVAFAIMLGMLGIAHANRVD